MGSLDGFDHNNRRSRLTAEDVRIGCAEWTIPAQYASLFPPSGGHLERYAQRFTAVKINRSFCRPHRQSTYRRWGATVPDGFAFAVKAPKEIMHDLHLAEAGPALEIFPAQASGLGAKLGHLGVDRDGTIQVLSSGQSSH